MGVTLLSGMILVLTAGDLHLGGSVGAGGGYDTNLTLAPAGQPTYDSAVAAVWAGLGPAVTLRSAAHLYVGLRYDGAAHPSASDLDSNAGGVELLWVQDIGEHLALVAAPATSWSWYRDAARSGPGVSVRGVLRVKPISWLALRGGYGYARRWANDAVYSTTAHRFGGEVEARLSRGIHLALGYALVVRDETFYAEAAPVTTGALASAEPPGSGRGGGGDAGPSGTAAARATAQRAVQAYQQRGPPAGAPVSSHRGTGVFQDLVPYLASATERTLSASFEATVWNELYLFATYAYTWGSSEQEDYATQSVFGGAGYRF